MSLEIPRLSLLEFEFGGLPRAYKLDCDGNQCSIEYNSTKIVISKEHEKNFYAYKLYCNKFDISGKRFAMYHAVDFARLLDSFELSLQYMVLAGEERDAVMPVVNMIEEVNSLIGRRKDCSETTCTRKGIVDSPLMFNWNYL